MTQLTMKERETAKLWAERIIADNKAHARGATKKYPSPDEQLASGGTLMDMPTVAGKPLGDCTGLEGRIMGEAYRIVSQHAEAIANARDLILAELR